MGAQKQNHTANKKEDVFLYVPSSLYDIARQSA